MLITFLSLHTTLNPHHLRLIVKFHTKQIFHINLLNFQTRPIHHFLPNLIIPSIESLMMQYPIPTFIKTLKIKLLFRIPPKFFPTPINYTRNIKFYFYQFLFLCYLLYNFSTIIFKYTITNKCFFYLIMIITIKFSY